MSAADRVRQNDIGVVFEVTLQDKGVAVDLTGNSALELVFRKPDGTRLNKTAALSGGATLGVIKYTSISGDLDQIGSWSLQAHIIIPNGDFRSEAGDFVVERAI